MKLILLGSLMLGFTARTGAAVPAMMGYQGRVSVDGVEFTGTGGFKFALIRGDDGETLWSNDGTLEKDSEPAAEVSIPVDAGLFVVSLGDTALPNMLPLAADLFVTNPDIRLRVWFNDGLNGSFLLSPDTILGSVPYAMAANIAVQSITGAHLAEGSVDPVKLAGANTPEPGWVLGFDGAGFHWSPPYASPAVLRSAREGVPDQFLQMEGGDPTSIRLTAQSVAGAEKPLVIRNLSGETTPGDNNAIEFALGTSDSPSTKMTITKDGNVLMRPGGSGGTIQFGTPNFETGMTVVGVHRADVRFDGSALKLVAGQGTAIPPPENGVAIHTSGKVGVGTTNPSARLQADSTGAETALFGQALGGGIGVYGFSNGGAAFFAEGNAVQWYDNGGFVKALLHVRQDGVIVSCYNGTRAGPSGSTGDCQFSCTSPQHGVYRIDFGFPVRDRFLSITTRYSSGSGPDNHMGANYEFDEDPSVVNVFTFSTNQPEDTDSASFMILVF